MSDKDAFEKYQEAEFKATSMGKPTSGPVEDVPPARPRETVLVKEENKFWFYAFCVLIILLVVFLLFKFWPSISAFAKETVRLEQEIIKQPRNIIEAPQKPVAAPRPRVTVIDGKPRIKALEKDVAWLQTLLKRAKKANMVHLENLATSKVRIENLSQQKTLDEKYHEFLKYSLDQFYQVPMGKNEKVRTICYSTANQKNKCYSVQRPESWGERRLRRRSLRRPIKRRRLR